MVNTQVIIFIFFSFTLSLTHYIYLSLSLGAPTEGQTFEYAKTVLDLMCRGEVDVRGKILIIGGGIANFTDVAATFKGIIKAIKEYQHDLQRYMVNIYIRRGGPNYQQGLQLMRDLGKKV